MEFKTVSLTKMAVRNAGTGSFSGYASTFGNLDLQGDVVAPGAFTDTLPQFLERGVINWAHNWDMPVGTVADAHEDRRGLWIACDFHSDQRSQDARTWTRERLERDKFVGLSIGFQATDVDQDGETRVLKAIHLFETSLVGVPANPEAGVLEAKSLAAAVPATQPFVEYWDHEIPPDTLAAAQEAVAVAQVRLGLTRTPELRWVAPGVPGKRAIYLPPKAHGWYRWDENAVYIRLSDDLATVVKTIGHELCHLAAARRDQLSDADSAGNHVDEQTAEAFGERLLASLIHRRFLVG